MASESDGDEILISDLLSGVIDSCVANWEWTKQAPPGSKDEISMLSVDVCVTFKTLSRLQNEEAYGYFEWPIHSLSDDAAHDQLLSCLAELNLFPHVGAEFAVLAIFELWGQMAPRVSTHGWVSRMDVELEVLVSELPCRIRNCNLYHQSEDYDYDDIEDDEEVLLNDEEDEDGDDWFVAASEEAIEGLERIRVSEEVSGKACVVCLEDILVGSEATRLPCWHFFHVDCIVQWLNTSKFCPFCRFELPD